MRKSVVFVFTLAAIGFLSGCAGRQSTEPPRSDAVVEDRAPMGRLGHVIGTYLTIEGTRAERGKVGVKTLLVDTVNGQRLEHPTGIWVDNVKGLPESTRCVFKGYESARWIGMPPGVAEATGGQLPQAAWQLYRYFVVTSVVSPASVELR
jgi:hypothetical protein